ncbi:hypothetical protein Tco_0260831 [Tanacetum coccineum]
MDNNESGYNIDRAELAFKPCWRILKNHVAWKEVEIHLFYKKQNKGSKKAKTSETTSGLAHGGLNLNEEADGYVEEVRVVRPIGQDRAKKKHHPPLVLNRHLLQEEVLLTRLSINGKALSQLEVAYREVAELKRDDLALQRQTLELKLKNKWDKDLIFYNSRIDKTLPLMQQQNLMELKQEVEEHYHLDY